MRLRVTLLKPCDKNVCLNENKHKFSSKKNLTHKLYCAVIGIVVIAAAVIMKILLFLKIATKKLLRCRIYMNYSSYSKSIWNWFQHWKNNSIWFYLIFVIWYCVVWRQFSQNRILTKNAYDKQVINLFICNFSISHSSRLILLLYNHIPQTARHKQYYTNKTSDTKELVYCSPFYCWFFF